MNLEKPSDVLSCDPPLMCPCLQFEIVLFPVFSPPDCRLGSAAPDSHPELLLLCLMLPARPNPVCTRYNLIHPLRKLNSSRGVKVRGTVDTNNLQLPADFQQEQPCLHRRPGHICVRGEFSGLTHFSVSQQWFKEINCVHGDILGSFFFTWIGKSSIITLIASDRRQRRESPRVQTSSVSSSFIHNQLIVFCHH